MLKYRPKINAKNTPKTTPHIAPKTPKPTITKDIARKSFKIDSRIIFPPNKKNFFLPCNIHLTIGKEKEEKTNIFVKKMSQKFILKKIDKKNAITISIPNRIREIKNPFFKDLNIRVLIFPSSFLIFNLEVYLEIIFCNASDGIPKR